VRDPRATADTIRSSIVESKWVANSLLRVLTLLHA